MGAVLNDKGEVLTRYVIKNISGSDWDDTFSKISAYKAIKIEETATGKVKNVKVMFRVPLTQEWIGEYSAENHGFKCQFCNDTGIKKDRDYCHCDLGATAYKYFANKDAF